MAKVVITLEDTEGGVNMKIDEVSGVLAVERVESDAVILGKAIMNHISMLQSAAGRMSLKPEIVQ